jgi:hypothetical protein
MRFPNPFREKYRPRRSVPISMINAEVTSTASHSELDGSSSGTHTVRFKRRWNTAIEASIEAVCTGGPLEYGTSEFTSGARWTRTFVVERPAEREESETYQLKPGSTLGPHPRQAHIELEVTARLVDPRYAPERERVTHSVRLLPPAGPGG